MPENLPLPQGLEIHKIRKLIQRKGPLNDWGSEGLIKGRHPRLVQKVEDTTRAPHPQEKMIHNTHNLPQKRFESLRQALVASTARPTSKAGTYRCRVWEKNSTCRFGFRGLGVEGVILKGILKERWLRV